MLERQTTMGDKGIMKDAIDGFIPGNSTPVKVGAPAAPTIYSAASTVLGNLARFEQSVPEETLSSPSDVEVVKLVPHGLDAVQEAACFDWASAGSGLEELEDQADEIDWATQYVILLRTRAGLGTSLSNKLWDDQYTLSLRGFAVICEIWGERLKSGEWCRGRALAELDKERNRLQRLANYVIDPVLKSLMAEQDSFLKAKEIEFMADK